MRPEGFEQLAEVRHNVLDHGFVVLKDVMGDEHSIAQAARVSYGEGTRSIHDDRTLIRYLLRHRHCYAPWMQVLTARGWIRWDECLAAESYAVPDPVSRTLQFEELPTESFEADDGLHLFDNARMSYAVTPDHRMWFKSKYQHGFRIVPVQEMPLWGHFDPLIGYQLPNHKGETDKPQLLGFYLGDGSYASPNTVSFHLRKSHKKEYLRGLCSRLGIDLRERQSPTYSDAVVFSFDTPEWMKSALGELLPSRAADKGIPEPSWRLGERAWCSGIKKGLEASDGHGKEDRNQCQVSSASPAILRLYQAVCAMVGVDAHEGRVVEGVGVATSYPGGDTSLESRKQHHSFRAYKGRVYCTTTSTGLLMVRGGSDKFAFVCGNTTPLEMVELKFHVRVPIDCWRQWIRHRTASVNEYSTRYSVAIDVMQATDPTQWRLQSGVNKQGSAGVLTDWPSVTGLVDLTGNIPGPPTGEGGGYETPGEYLSTQEAALHTAAWQVYQARLGLGVAREQARKVLPMATYTEAYWKIDLHNLLHFLGLRMDSHAQQEIRTYAHVIGGIVAKLYPNVWQAFCDYRLDAVTMTRLDQLVITNCIQQGYPIPTTPPAWESEIWPEAWRTAKCREREECVAKLLKMGLFVEIPF